MQGKIVKAIAGFYYVDAVESGIYKCRARGIFRKNGVKPLVGDDAEMEVTHEGDREGNVISILRRRNELRRPEVANIDQVLILMAFRDPNPNFLLLDRFLLSAETAGVPCLICFNKADAAREKEADRILADYGGCGYPVDFISVRTGLGLEDLRARLAGKTTVLAGPSGVGKSSLTNALSGRVMMETGEISRKLARGKNTTRHSQLLDLGEGTFLCDTPGFSALDTATLPKEELGDYYGEFRPYDGMCRFQGCVHVGEPDCAVKEAAADGRISRLRYENYVQLYEELKEAERRKYL